MAVPEQQAAMHHGRSNDSDRRPSGRFALVGIKFGRTGVTSSAFGLSGQPTVDASLSARPHLIMSRSTSASDIEHVLFTAVIAPAAAVPITLEQHADQHQAAVSHDCDWASAVQKTLQLNLHYASTTGQGRNQHEAAPPAFGHASGMHRPSTKPRRSECLAKPT